jgi:hypothetical protein
MKSANDFEVPKTQIAVKLQQEMDKAGMTMRDLAADLDMTYEFVRRLLRGDSLMSKANLKVMSARFKWNYPEMEKMLVQDRFRRNNGAEGAIAQAFNPEVDPFEKGWALLNDEQKEMLLSQLYTFIRINRHTVRSGIDPTAQDK